MKLIVDNTQPLGRELNEAEVRAGLTAAMLMLSKARRTMARWAYAEIRPDDTQLLALCSQLLGVERAIMDVATDPPSDGHGLDDRIDRLVAEVEELQTAPMAGA